MPLRMACLLKGWRLGHEIAGGIGISPATLGRALRGDPVGAQFIAATTFAFGPESYGEIYEVTSDER